MYITLAQVDLLNILYKCIVFVLFEKKTTKRLHTNNYTNKFNKSTCAGRGGGWMEWIL